MEAPERGFRGKKQFLSNMYETEIKIYGKTFSCSESAFQYAKCANAEEAEKIVPLSGREAKSMGRKVQMRSDWNEARLSAMEEIVHVKFQNPDLRSRLLNTYQEELVEYNTWHDTYWGVDDHTEKGENHLGKILMAEREIVRSLVKPIAKIEESNIFICKDENNRYYKVADSKVSPCTAKEAYQEILSGKKNGYSVKGRKNEITYLKEQLSYDTER